MTGRNHTGRTAMSVQVDDRQVLLNRHAPDFALVDHRKVAHRLDTLMGDGGLLMGFVPDVWQPVNVRRILWLQRYAAPFRMLGTPVVIIAREHPQALAGFCRTSPLPVPLRLLADSDGAVHTAYGMFRQSGLVLLDRAGVVRTLWEVPPTGAWPTLKTLRLAVQQVQVTT